MKQDNSDVINKHNTPKEKKEESMEDWRDEHGQPNFEFLKSLAIDGDPLNLEKLKSIADDLNVPYDDDNSNQELVEKIMLAARSGLDTTT